jgi:hypothetical protein
MSERQERDELIQATATAATSRNTSRLVGAVHRKRIESRVANTKIAMKAYGHEKDKSVQVLKASA